MAMTLRLDDIHDAMLAELARTLGCSKHQAILRAIEMADERLRIEDRAVARVQHLLETRDKELMDRLADA
jgi:hypothetical protein